MRLHRDDEKKIMDLETKSLHFACDNNTKINIDFVVFDLVDSTSSEKNIFAQKCPLMPKRCNTSKNV